MCDLSSTNTLELIAKVCDLLLFVATLELNIPSLSFPLFLPAKGPEHFSY